MKLQVTIGDVKVSLSNGGVIDFGNADLQYTNASEPGTAAPYTVEVEADTADELRALIACAEGDNDTATRVLNVLSRTEKLLSEWQSAVKGSK